MSETIYLTVEPIETTIELEVTQNPAINVMFSPISIPSQETLQEFIDTTTSTATEAAEQAIASAASALTSEQNASNSETAAEAAQLAAQAAATYAETAIEQIIWNDVIFVTSGDSPLTLNTTSNGKLYAVDCTSGAVVINLPQISTLDLDLPFSLGIKKTDASANAITVNRASTDTIDGGTSKTINDQNSGATFIPEDSPSPDAWQTCAFGSTPADGSITKAKLAVGARDLTISSKTSSYTLASSDELITCNATSGAFTLTLPTAVGISGRVYYIKKTDTTLNAITVDGSGAETIDGALTRVLSTQYESLKIVSNGSNWTVLERSIPSDWESCGHVAADFTGFGTPTNIETQCKRDGSDLLIKGKFSPGTTTAVEARLALKFRGASLTSAGTSIIPSIQLAGDVARNASSASYFGNKALIEPSVGYMAFSVGSSATDYTTKMLGTAVSLGQTIMINTRIPIAGWES